MESVSITLSESDNDTNNESNIDTESVIETDSIHDTICTYTCLEHCILIGGAVMAGNCAEEGFKCCDLGTTDVIADSDTDTYTNTDADTDTGITPDTTSEALSDECSMDSEITYILHQAQAPTADQKEAYDLITEAMDTAVWYYSCYTNITEHIDVYYNPSVETAQANITGPVIEFGSRASMNHITAMHEISHTVGVAYYSWSTMFNEGVWKGEQANTLIKEVDNDPSAVIYGDKMHFWPYGLNFTTEVDSEQDLINHCRIVVALRADMGVF